MSAKLEQFISLEDYFHGEESGEIKHEYFQGAIYALAGASVSHNLIVAHVLGGLDTQLHGKACTAFPSDLRLKVAATGLCTYPDVSVVCGAIDYATGDGTPS